MPTSYTTTPSGIHVPTNANDGDELAAGLLQMATEQETAYRPGAWVPLTLPTGFGTQTNMKKASARLELGNVVRLKGWVSNGTGSSLAAFSAFATLPSPSMFPASFLATIVVGPISPPAATVMEINQDGTLQLAAAFANATTVDLTGVTFALT